MKDYEGFAQSVEPWIKDLYLDENEKGVLIGEAEERFGLPASEAENHLIRLCLRSKVVIEDLEAPRFRQRVQIAAAGRVLDAETRALLAGEGRQRFTGANHPEALVDRLIAEGLEAAGAWDGEQLKQEIRKQLRAEAAGSRIDAGRWRRIHSQVLGLIGAEAGEEPDVVDLLHDCRSELGIRVDPDPVLPPPPDETGSSLGKILGVAVIVGALVFAGLMFLDPSGSEPMLTGSEPPPFGQLPACDDGCKEDLKVAVESLRRMAGNPDLKPNVEYMLRKVATACAPYEELLPQVREYAEEASPAWKGCRDEAIAGARRQLGLPQNAESSK